MTDEPENTGPNYPQSLDDLHLDDAAWADLTTVRRDAREIARRDERLTDDGLMEGTIKRESQKFSKQAIEHDYYDVRAWRRVQRDNPDVDKALKGYRYDEQQKAYVPRRRKTGSEDETPTEQVQEYNPDYYDPDEPQIDGSLAAGDPPTYGEAEPVRWPHPDQMAFDLYNGLYKDYPILDKRLDPRYAINGVAMQAVMETPEYLELHAQTVLDEFSSGIGISVLAEKIMDDERLQQAAQTIADAQPPKQGEDESDEDFAQRLAKWKQQQERAQRELRAAMRQALKAAQQEVDNANDGLAAFGMPPGLGDSDTSMLTSNAREKMKLAREVMHNEQLRKIAQFAGRFKRLAVQAQRSRVESTPDEVYAVTQGNDLSRMLPAELLRLTMPELEGAFYRDFVERRVPQYELNRPAKEMRGPIVVAIDESGSMSGLPDAWAKAAFLALHGIATSQQRDLRVIHFASGHQVRTDDFLHESRTVVTTDHRGTQQTREMGPATTMECALHFFAGGTDYDIWMEKALESIEQSQWSKADVILISDGAAYVSDEVRQRWLATKEAKAFKAYGILIADWGDAGEVEQVCDAYTTLRHTALGDGEQDSDALLQAFGV